MIKKWRKYANMLEEEFNEDNSSTFFKKRPTSILEVIE